MDAEYGARSELVFLLRAFEWRLNEQERVNADLWRENELLNAWNRRLSEERHAKLKVKDLANVTLKMKGIEMLDKVLQNAGAILLLFWAAMGGLSLLVVLAATLLGRTLDQQTFGLVSSVIGASIGGIGSSAVNGLAARAALVRLQAASAREPKQ